MNIAEVTPCTAVSDMNVFHMDALIGENRRNSVDTVATMFNISVGVHMASSMILSNITVFQVGAEIVER
jgi:hypothetical protein